MFDRNAIIISPLANGFSVALPEEAEANMNSVSGMMEAFPQIMQSAMSAINKDEVLQDIEIKNNKKPKSKSKEASLDLNNHRQKNIYVFSTFPEVLAFLKVVVK